MASQPPPDRDDPQSPAEMPPMTEPDGTETGPPEIAPGTPNQDVPDSAPEMPEIIPPD